MIGSFFTQPFLKSKKILERIVEPDARGRAAEKVIMAGEDMPHLARFPNLRLSDLKVVERDALAVEHSKNIMIGLHKQRCGIGKWIVRCEPCCLRVTVGTDDGQIADLLVESPGDFASRGFSREQSIVVEQHGINSTAELRPVV